LERSSDILLMLRVSDTPYDSYIANYCQPSKIGEYLLSGTPILATKIPAIPEEFDEFLNYTDNDPQAVANAICQICSTKYDSYLEKALKGREFALDNCTLEKLDSDVCGFIDTLCKQEAGYEQTNK